jgi:hypothetical protein
MLDPIQADLILDSWINIFPNNANKQQARMG